MMDDGIPVNYASFADEETWFELIISAGRTFSYMPAASANPEDECIELYKGHVDEIADVVLDYAGTYPLVM